MDRDDLEREARERWDRAVMSVIEPVVKPGAADLRAARACIRKVLEAQSQGAAAEAFEAIWDCGFRSAARAEAVFAAAQELRDLGLVDEAESAAIFELAWAERFQRVLFEDLDVGAADELRDADIEVPNTPEFEARADEYHRRSGPGLAAFLEARGESQLAGLVRADLSRFDRLCARGEFLLVKMKPADAPNLTEPPDAKRVAWASERILGILGEPRQARGAALGTFVLEMSPSDTMAAVAAVQELRECGLVSRGEAAGLLETFLLHAYIATLQADRELQRMVWDWPIAEPEEDGQGPRPFTVLELVRSPHPLDEGLAWRLGDRLYRVKASLLRQVGEHELANLALRERTRYARMVEGSGLFAA